MSKTRKYLLKEVDIVPENVAVKLGRNQHAEDVCVRSLAEEEWQPCICGEGGN